MDCRLNDHASNSSKGAGNVLFSIAARRTRDYALILSNEYQRHYPVSNATLEQGNWHFLLSMTKVIYSLDPNTPASLVFASIPNSTASHYKLFFSSSCSHFWSTGLISQFLDHSQTVGLLGRVISSSQGLYLNTGQHKHRINAQTDIHALSGIRTHDPSSCQYI
jgi:hypothetical protein